jgi:hypothetical protein
MGNDIPTRAREVVRERQNHQCARCGNRYQEIHHRMRRREGLHGYENLVGLCSSDHRWVHKHPKQAAEEGYIIPISVDDISAVPIHTFMGWLTFDSDGGSAFAPELEGQN